MGVIRKTKAVEVLLAAFDTKAVALSAKALIDQLGTTFNKTTIYRVLDKLEDDGVLHSFLGKEGLKWYAKCHGCTSTAHHDVHPHFQCLNCGKVECLAVSVTLPKIPNRKIEVSQLLIQGKCEECFI
ncbi:MULTISPECIES: Fur family transcriptional regulator [Cellulophaga]|uniref:Fur family transcriptional regulator, ferric uptake regulator n=1 Tax=Cellulophaga baltica TaxID=76594 RepID=A0A1G7HTQ8_9FLAO|nr:MULTISPECIES: transcriptional repressor [Cellulophaga]SDF03728.1 Fur family transcriptional regulator, ferric uptake regulator [Cellulophaga baltica]